MRIFKTKWFHRWAAKEGLGDEALISAVEEVERGLVDADLGRHMVKKRIALPGRGKRGSVRTLIAFKQTHRVFFIYGFAKNARANIDDAELRALKQYAKTLLGYSEKVLTKAIEAKILIEIANDE